MVSSPPPVPIAAEPPLAEATGGGRLRVLILGGSSEATRLAKALAGQADVAASLSLAGRTEAPADQPLPVRVGGFGGAEGLAAYLRRENIAVLVDATHPFAAQMSRHARLAAAMSGCSLVAVRRPPWTPEPGDAWTDVGSAEEAAVAIGTRPRRVFLTVGRLQLSAFAAVSRHRFLVRTIDAVPPELMPARTAFVRARGPFALADERQLLLDHGIEVLVTKNSGGTASRAKLDAARDLGLAVILVRRPVEDGPGLGVDEAIEVILAHRSSARRGV